MTSEFLITNDELRLMWWRVGLEDTVIRDHNIENLLAITINGANRKEAKLIKNWCANNDIYKISRTYRWKDEYKFINHNDEFDCINFTNNERIIIAEQDVIVKLEAWLATLPQRHIDIVVENISLSCIKAIIKKYNVRLLTDQHNKKNHIVSLNDPILQFELTLRSY